MLRSQVPRACTALGTSALRSFVGRRTIATLPLCDHQPSAYNGPSLEEVWETRKKHLSPALVLYYKRPVMMVEGHMQYMWDEKGKRYLDGIGGIVTISVGHCHPYVLEKASEQLKKLWHTTSIYLNPQASEYAEMLTARMPGNLKVVYFVNSGSEANDMALVMARAYTGNYDAIALRNAYHGMSPTAMGLTALHTWKYPQAHGFGIHHALNPDVYRGRFSGPEAGQVYAEDVKDLVEHGTSGRISAFFAECIQGVGGAVELPPGYLKEVYPTIRKAGGLCVADEVQTGFGRTGTHYWGFEAQGVIPDIVTLAKGMGNGTPLAAVVTTPEIATAMKQRIHFNTFGGNPVSCAIGKAVLEVIDKEKLQERCKDVGGYLKAGLCRLYEKHSVIGHVRGQGMMLGVEFVKDRTTKEPAIEETACVFERIKDLGLVVGKGGLYGNVLRIKPPMCWTKADVDFAVDVLDQACSEL